MPPKKKAANGYKFAEPLPKGEVLQDLTKKKWKLGVSIGKGGFGEIYCAQEVNATGTKYPYVIKIEPHANGPLFVERNFYINNAKSEDVENFKKEHGYKTLGMPVYIGSGTHEFNNEKYRFLVMEKFGTDLWKLYLDNNKIFPTDTVFKVAIQILDVLEYIHSKGYVHADIKGANILMGATKETQDKQVYLVDFGLACKYSTDKEFKANPKKAHDGTIEYLSRDAHYGVQTRRGDLEILVYNMIQWLGCKLPWEKNLTDPKVVQASKEQHMTTHDKILKACFGTKTPPSALESFLKYLKTLNCDSEPDYKKIKNIFTAAVKQAGGSLTAPLQFSNTKKTPTKRKSTSGIEVIDKKPRTLRTPIKNINYKDPSTSDGEGLKKLKKRTRKVIKKGAKKEDSEDEHNSSNDEVFDYPEEIEVKKQTKKVVKKTTKKEDDQNSDSGNGLLDDTIEAPSNNTKSKNVTSRRKNIKVNGTGKGDADHGDANGNAFDGYTDAMKEVMMKKMQNGRSKVTKQKPAESESEEDNMEGYTEEMKQLASKKKNRTETKTSKKRTASKTKDQPLVAIATSSRAKNKDGLVKLTSRRLKKEKEEPPMTHGNVVSCSESDSE